jgi:hypothetical protein
MPQPREYRILRLNRLEQNCRSVGNRFFLYFTVSTVSRMSDNERGACPLGVERCFKCADADGAYDDGGQSIPIELI